MFSGSYRLPTPRSSSTLALPSSVRARGFGFFFHGEMHVELQVRDDFVDSVYLSVESSFGPEMISGVRASSIKIESHSSMIA